MRVRGERLVEAHRGAGAMRLSLAVACVVGACSGGGPERVVQQTSALTVPVPALGQYVVLASRNVSFGDRAIVSGGDIGVAASVPPAAPSTLLVGFDGRVGVGEVLLAQRVTLRDRAVVGEIGANQIDAPLAITGPRSPFLAPPSRPLPGAVNPGSTPVAVASGQTSTLPPGRYGAMTVGGTLNLSGGLYEVQSLQIGNDARVVARASSVVRVAGGLLALDRAAATPAAPLRAADLRILVAGVVAGGTSAIQWGNDGVLTALVTASAPFTAGARLIAAGAISARDVTVGNDARLSFDGGFGCTAAASCNDGNTCTADACTDGQCVHPPVANGTTCNDGNACTLNESCQAGACVASQNVVCAARDQCHDPGICDPTSGVCSNPPKPRPDPPGAVVRFPLLPRPAIPTGIVLGTDGDLWFTEARHDALARITLDGMITEFPVPTTTESGQRLLTLGADGNLWFTEGTAINKIRRMTQSGVVSEFETPNPVFERNGALILGPDGNVWFATGTIDGAVNNIARITPDGVISEFRAPDGVFPSGFTTGPDGNIWFHAGQNIGRITTAGAYLPAFPVPGVSGSSARKLALGADGNIWFIGPDRSQITRMTATGATTVFPAPQPLTPEPEANTMVPGPDGNVWFTTIFPNGVGFVTPAGAVTVFQLPAGHNPIALTAGPDCAIWMTDGFDFIDRVTP